MLNPVAIYCGLVSVAMLLTHGAAWLLFKAEGPVASRAGSIGSVTAVATSALFAGGGVLVWLGLLGGYRVTSPIAWGGPSNPLGKAVVADSGAWLANFASYPVLWLVPALGVVLPLVVALGLRLGKGGFALLVSKLTIAMIISTVGLAMFPILLPSITEPSHSLTVFDASSSHATLRNMLIATVVFLPIVLAYTGWVYSVLWGKVSEASIKTADHAY